MMAGIKGKNTRPEMRVRKELFAAGYRFRLHRKDLPGSPDIVLPGRKIAIFVNGCFWHGHPDCRLAARPATRSEFWQAKLARNRERDLVAVEALRDQGWRVLVIWECFIRWRQGSQEIAAAVAEWMASGQVLGDLAAPSSPHPG